MNKYITLAFILIIFSGCHKSMSDAIDPVKTGTIVSNYKISLNVTDQNVVTSVKQDTLFLNYFEKVTLLLNPNDFKKASALHIKEDFSKTSLSSYEYTIRNSDGTYRHNSVDDNMNNNVSYITASTVVVNGTTYTQVVLQRNFVFFKAYKLQQLAIEAQTNFVGVSGDQIGFSSFYYLDSKNTSASVITAKLIYQ